MSTLSLRLAALGSWVLLPVYVFQGIGVRLRSRRLPPAIGPVRARLGGAEPAVSILVVGDSSVAGTGGNPRPLRRGLLAARRCAPDTLRRAPIPGSRCHLSAAARSFGSISRYVHGYCSNEWDFQPCTHGCSSTLLYRYTPSIAGAYV